MRFSYSFWKIIISARNFCLFVIIRFVFRCLKLYFVFQLLFVMGFLSNSPAITSFQLQLTNSLSRGRFSQSLFLFCLSFWNSYFFVFIFPCAYCKILFRFLYFRFVLLFFSWFADIVCSRYLYCVHLCIIYVISGNHTDLFSHPIVFFFGSVLLSICYL